MLKQGLEKHQSRVIDTIKEGKEFLVLAPANKDDIKLYRVGSHISIVKSIEKNYTSNGMARLILQFQNMEVETIAFIDYKIQVGSVVNTIGFLLEEYGVYKYYCKGGINLMFNTIEDIQKAYNNKIYASKVYSTGIVFELSKITAEETVYPKEGLGVKPLENVDNFYYIIKEHSKIEDVLNKFRNTAKANLLDTSILISEDEEDYPDEDTPIGVGENDNQ